MWPLQGVAAATPAARNRWRREALAGVVDNAAGLSYRALCWWVLHDLGARLEAEIPAATPGGKENRQGPSQHGVCEAPALG